jgi:L-alanine-DL-glutamate epimerase-like enolase superfamily enzyme
MSLSLSVAVERFPVAGTFTISRGSRTEAVVVTATLSDGRHTGRGECVPYARYGETVEGVAAAIEAQAPKIAGGLDRAGLQRVLPPGAARNALDCAFWDLAAKRSRRPVWQLAGLPAPKPVVTAFTLSLDTPEAMRAKAAENAHRPLLKIKLGTPDDLPRLRAVREGAPAARLIIDANEGWSAADYAALAPELVGLGVELVEQPLPSGADGALEGLARPLPVCADEACHGVDSLAGLVGRYDWINVKLDKTGGLTEALALVAAARAAGLKVMVGCMLASSLAMAPALLLAQPADLADLDGPLLLASDRPHGIEYDDAGAHPPAPELWG